MLVSLDQARSHLRVGADYPVEQVQIYLDAAEEQAQQFLGRNVYATADSLAEAVAAGTAGDLPMVLNKSIVAAVLLIVGHLFTNRSDVVTGAGFELPQGSRYLLWPFRVGLGA